MLKVYNRFKVIGRIHISAFNHNVKELPLTLKYTIYSTMSLWQKRFHTFSRKKNLRRSVVKSCRCIFCLPYSRKSPSFQPLKPEELVFKRAIDWEITDCCSFCPKQCFSLESGSYLFFFILPSSSLSIDVISSKVNYILFLVWSFKKTPLSEFNF